MYDVAVEVLRDMGRNIRGDDVADQLAGPRISPLAGEECAPEEKGVFVFCYMSGKDIAQSSGEYNVATLPILRALKGKEGVSLVWWVVAGVHVL